MITCPRCGEPLADGTRFCTKCGTAVEPPANSVYKVPAPFAAEQPPEKKSRFSVVGFWAYVGLIVLFEVPFFGLIANIIFACDVTGKQNITNFARAYLAVKLAVILLGGLLLLLLYSFLGAAIAHALSQHGAGIFDWDDIFDDDYFEDRGVAAVPLALG